MLKNLLNTLQKKKENKKGFTLVEIIVVLVILAILAAIAVPAVTGYIQDAKDSQYITEARAIYIVVQTEEARCEATGTTVSYADIATTAQTKTKLTGITITKNGDVYTVTWTPDGATGSATAEITKNKEVKITARP